MGYGNFERYRSAMKDGSGTQFTGVLASFSGHYLAAVEKNREKAWYQYYVTDRKWWTLLVRNVDSFGNDGNVPTQ